MKHFSKGSDEPERPSLPHLLMSGFLSRTRLQILLRRSSFILLAEERHRKALRVKCVTQELVCNAGVFDEQTSGNFVRVFGLGVIED